MSEVARPKAGETVRVPGWGECTVMESTDPTLITLRIEWTGREVRVGDVALMGLVEKAEGVNS